MGNFKIRKAGSLLCAFVVAALLVSCGNAEPSRFRAEFAGPFDTMTLVVGYAKREKDFSKYSTAIYDKMTELDKLYDIYREYDGINNLYTVNKNAGIAPVKVDRAIIDMLIFAREGYYLTDGVVNTAMGAVLSVWHDYRAEGVAVPPMDVLRQASLNVDINDLIIDEVVNTVFLKNVGMSLDVGASAKAYAAGLAVDEAVKAGAESILLSAGGNITAVNKPLDGRDKWGVGIQDPSLDIEGVQNTADTVFINDMTVSCSGGYQRYYIVDGVVYNHIIDPVTLMPASRYLNVTVVHPQPEMADVLSTALFILPYEQGRALALEQGAEAFWIFADGTMEATDGYKKISKLYGAE